MEILNIILILFALLTAYAATRARELISAIFMLGAFSFFLAIVWAMLAAPDVSFTEAMVGVGASTIFFVLALFNSNHKIKADPFDRKQLACLAVVGLLAGFFIWGSQDLASLGDIYSAASTYLSPYYLKSALLDSKTPNVVTAVVVDYRSFDTLIEVTVVFTAGVACLLIMRSES